MRVREVMKAEPTTVDERDSVALALQLMLWNDFRHLPVMHDETLVGVLTERDVLASRRVDGATEFGQLVRDAMTRSVATASPDEELESAATRMADAKIGCLPVMDGAHLVGLLTVTDALRALASREVPEPSHPDLAR